MLVLSRRSGESIIAEFRGLRLEIKIIGTSDGNVRIGFSGSREIAINREEIWQAIQAGKPKPEKS